MNNELYGATLWFVVAWPLLLAVPAVNRHLLCTHYLAIIPAALLMLIPLDVSSTLSWLLLGSGLNIDSDKRWLLAMSVVIWWLAAIRVGGRRPSAPYGQNTFYLLTLAGNLGVVLASDMVLFFSFATLMGYGFYGLLTQSGNGAARYYLICLIIADLLLFEALLLFFFNNESLLLSPLSEVSPFYLLMVFGGFALKAGLWPAHHWLCANYRSAPPLAVLLLALPITLALFGMLRWLPLGEASYEANGMALLLIGIAAMLYAARQLIRSSVSSMRLAWGSILASGLVTTSLGAGLANPLLWQTYGTLLYPLLALMGISLAGLSCARSEEPQIDLSSTMESRLAGWRNLIQQRVNHALATWYYCLHGARIKQHLGPRNRQGLTRLLAGWRSAITLFVLLGASLAWLII